MGMFDYLICEMDLPGQLPSWYEPGHKFQTKDTPEQYLADYRILTDGRLTGPGADGFTGDIEFYGSNVCGCHGPICYTHRGEDAESVTFVATVVRGLVTELRHAGYTIEPAVKTEPMELPTTEEVAEYHKKISEPHVGRDLYALWGGRDKGYTVKIIAENDKQLVAQALTPADYCKVGSFEILHRSSIGHTLFYSEEEAFEERREKREKFEAKTTKFQEYAAQWYAKRQQKESPP